MPSSSKQGKEKSAEWIKSYSDIQRILDVGCGEGTYPNLMKGKFNLLTDAEWWGVEAWANNITKYKLAEKYFKVLNQDVRKLNWDELPAFDLVIFGDVLEHMTKEESQTLVKTALHHTKHILISIPVKHMPQDAVGGNPFEIHVKDNWTHQEVLESFPNICMSSATKKIGVYWISSNIL